MARARSSASFLSLYTRRRRHLQWNLTYRTQNKQNLLGNYTDFCAPSEILDTECTMYPSSFRGITSIGSGWRHTKHLR